MINGVDVSSYQGTIDWSIMAGTDAQYLWMRGAVGKGVDAMLPAYTTGCKNIGMPFGLYYVIKPAANQTSWKEQAQLHADIDDLYGAPLIPAIDCELNGGLSKAVLSDWVFKYLKRFTELTGRDTMIYTSAGWWNANIARNDWAKQHLLWVANYTLSQSPLIPDDWGAIHQPKDWTIWQWSADGNNQGAAYGCQSDDIDLDRFDGTEADFTKTFGVKPRQLTVTPPPPPPGQLPEFVTVKANATNIRNSTNLLKTSDVGDLTAGARLNVLSDAGDFWAVKLYIHKTVVK